LSSRARALIAVTALVILSAGCSTNRDLDELFDPSAVGTLVVDGVLIVGERLPPVFVRQILAADEAYDPELAAVSCSVSIYEGDLEYEYREQTLGDTTTGRYLPVQNTALIKPGTRYTLGVRTPDGRRVTATTVTPNRFAVSDWVLLDEETLEVRRTLQTFADSGDIYEAPENQIVYQDGLLEARFRPGDNADRYHIGLQSLDLDSDFVIEGDFLDEEDYADFQRQTSSPALEATGEFVRLPWFAIFFEGRYKIRVYAVDQNWFDLARSSPELVGIEGPSFGGNAGDDFDRPIFHVEGGIGLFGSGAVDSIGFRILPRE
jgi:uncharacterized protein DUF4249